MAFRTKAEEQAAAAATMATAPAAMAAGLASAAADAAGAPPTTSVFPSAPLSAASASVSAARTAAMANAAVDRTTAVIDRTADSLKGSIAQTASSVEQTQARMKEGMEKAMQTTEDFVAFGQGNFEALVKSGQIWAVGLQDLGKQVAATAQAQIAETMFAFKAMAGAKSVKDAFEVQANLARTAMEKTLAESSRLTETSIKLTEQALAPVTARVSLAVEKFGRAV